MATDSGVFIRQECITLAGDLVAGVLLSQIVYWYLPDTKGKTKLRVKRHGVYWIAKTREEWMKECGLTPNQYRRVIKVLQQKHLVEMKVMKFRGLTMSHLRLLQPIAGVMGENHSSSCLVKTTHPDELLSLTVNTETTTESTHKDLATKERSLERTVDDQGRTYGKSKEEKIKSKIKIGEEKSHIAVVVEEQMNAKEILAAHTAPLTGSLGAYWKSRMTLITDGKYQHALTAKEHGQLKQLSKYLGDQTRPVIDYAVTHWWKFANKAAAAGGTLVPARPNIGYLLKHHAVAVELLMPSMTVPVKSKEWTKPTVQSSATTTETPDVYKPTPEELAKLIADLKSP